MADWYKGSKLLAGSLRNWLFAAELLEPRARVTAGRNRRAYPRRRTHAAG